ncbi:CACNA1S [Symbiodinium sp. CCMP2592]|nr:CACNA1S [Symbiodinium sp. CCMP2592]
MAAAGQSVVLSIFTGAVDPLVLAVKKEKLRAIVLSCPMQNLTEVPVPAKITDARQCAVEILDNGLEQGLDKTAQEVTLKLLWKQDKDVPYATASRWVFRCLADYSGGSSLHWDLEPEPTGLGGSQPGAQVGPIPSPSEAKAPDIQSHLVRQVKLLQRQPLEGYQGGGKLGEGSFGLVVRAKRATDNDDVAIKLLKDDLEAFQEVVFATQLQDHPNIVQLLDAGIWMDKSVLDNVSIDNMVDLFEMLDVEGNGRLEMDQFIGGLLNLVLLDVPLWSIQSQRMLGSIRTTVTSLDRDIAEIRCKLNRLTGSLNDGALGKDDSV